MRGMDCRLNLADWFPFAVLAIVIPGSAWWSDAQCLAQSGSGSVIAYPVMLESNHRAELAARVEGYVQQVRVDIGAVVRRGDPLLTIDAPDLEAELARKTRMLDQATAQHGVAQAAVVVAQSRVQQAEATRAEHEAMVNLRRSERQRLERLVRQGAVQADKLEEADYALEAAQAALKKIASDVAAAQADLAAARSALQFAAAGVEVARAEVLAAKVRDQMRTLTAPFDGVITARNIDPGELVGDGNDERGPLLVLEDVFVLRAVMAVPSQDAGRIHVGAPAELEGWPEVTGPDGRPLAVSRVSHALDESTRTMRVEIDVANPPDEKLGRFRLRSGQYGLGRIFPTADTEK